MSPRPPTAATVTPAPLTTRAARRLARRRMLRFLLGFVAAVLVADALFGDKGLVETLRARREHARLRAALEALRAENTRLREQARRLREDPAAIEEIARRELGLIRPGELLVIIKDVEGPAPRPEVPSLDR
jgi:cell division protein FtsB